MASRSLIHTLAVRTYSVLLELISLFFLPIGAVHPRVRRWGLPARRRPVSLPGGAPAGGTVWIHAASMGECKLLCRFVRLLDLASPGTTFVATTVTRTGLAYLEKHKPPSVTLLGLLPLDTIGRMRSLVRQCGVSRLWLLETELWPAMLWVCSRERIPVGVANARLEEGPYRRYRRLGVLFGPLMASLKPVLAQDETYAARYRSLGVRPEAVEVTGNLKAHVTIAPPTAAQRTALREMLGISAEEIVLTVGCAHPGEGAVVQQALRLLQDGGRRPRCVLVPRHREAVSDLLSELDDQARPFRVLEPSSEPWLTAVIDRYGVLDDLYALADIAVVGGTFVPVGGHNMWDAAQWGIPVIFGPHHQEQQQSCERLAAAGVGFEVDGARGLADAVTRLTGADRAPFIQACARLSEELVGGERTLLDILPGADGKGVRSGL